MEKRPIEPTTILKYTNSFKVVQKKTGGCLDVVQLIDFIKALPDVKDATKKVYLTSLLYFSEKLVGDARLIRSYMVELSKELDSQPHLTEKQEQALILITPVQIAKALQDLKVDRKYSAEMMEDYLLMVFLSKTPMRNDLREVHLTSGVPDQGNYIDLTTGHMEIRQHKTSKGHGSLIRKLSPELLSDVRWLKELDDRPYLFVKRDKYKKITTEPICSNLMTKRTENLSNRLFDFRAGVNCYRKIYCSNEYFQAVEGLKADAKLMGHTAGTAMEHYIHKV
jgi:hypothetical protein